MKGTGTEYVNAQLLDLKDFIDKYAKIIAGLSVGLQLSRNNTLKKITVQEAGATAWWQSPNWWGGSRNYMGQTDPNDDGTELKAFVRTAKRPTENRWTWILTYIASSKTNTEYPHRKTNNGKTVYFKYGQSGIFQNYSDGDNMVFSSNWDVFGANDTLGYENIQNIAWTLHYGPPSKWK